MGKEKICVFMVLLSGLMFTGCEKKAELKQNTFKVEVKEKLSEKATDYIKDASPKDKVTWHVKEADLNKLGSYPARFHYRNSDYDLTLEVVDRTVPVLKLNKDSFEFYIGDSSKTVNEAIQKEMQISDNYDEHLKKPDILKEADSPKGKITKTVKICDLSGNCSRSQKLWLNFKVREKEKVNKETKEEHTKQEQLPREQGQQLPKEPVESSQESPGKEIPKQEEAVVPPAKQPKEEPETTCVSDGKFQALGNSGRAGPRNEIEAWAWEQLDSDHGPMWKQGYAGFNEWTVYDNCGERNDIWTIDFY